MITKVYKQKRTAFYFHPQFMNILGALAFLVLVSSPWLERLWSSEWGTAHAPLGECGPSQGRDSGKGYMRRMQFILHSLPQPGVLILSTTTSVWSNCMRINQSYLLSPLYTYLWTPSYASSSTMLAESEHGSTSHILQSFSSTILNSTAWNTFLRFFLCALEY